MLLRHLQGFRWDETSLLSYREEPGTHFKNITRQILFDGGQSDLPIQLRYFEIQAGGYSTLEKHLHTHLVMIIRGEGHVLDGDQIYRVQEQDLIVIESGVFHQFCATGNTPLGFLCLVNLERDRPILPTDEEWEELCKNSQIAEFIRR